MYEPREAFEKVQKQLNKQKHFYRNNSLDSNNHLCYHKEYIEFLEEQNRLMLEALEEIEIDFNCGIIFGIHDKVKNIIQQITGKKIEEIN